MNYEELTENFLETFRNGNGKLQYLVSFAELVRSSKRPEVICGTDILQYEPNTLEYFECLISDTDPEMELENIYAPLVKLWGRCRDILDSDDVNINFSTRIILESCVDHIKYSVDHVGSVVLRQYEAQTGENLEGWECHDSYMVKGGRIEQNFHGNTLFTAVTLNKIHTNFWKLETARMETQELVLT